MSTTVGLTRRKAFGIFSLLILGAGFVGMIAGFEYFFVIWILGYAVVLPILGILFGEGGINREWNWRWESSRAREPTAEDATRLTDDDQTPTSASDALTTLRDRYAHGDLTEEEFDRKLDRLLETESPESAAKWREQIRENAK